MNSFSKEDTEETFDSIARTPGATWNLLFKCRLFMNI
jgi:hypothetical protein